MPYIRKHYTAESTCFSNIDSETTISQEEYINIPNLTGKEYRFLIGKGGTQILVAILEDLLADSGIAFTKINEYTFEIWGVKFSLPWLIYGNGNWLDKKTYFIEGPALVPYNQANIPCYDNMPTSANSFSARSNTWSLGTTGWCPTPLITDTKKDINTYGYLYYNENCVQFELRSHAAWYDGKKVPVFYIFKGKSILDENVAVLGATPCSWYKTMPTYYEANSGAFAASTHTTYCPTASISRSMLFNLDDISKNLFDPRTHNVSYNGTESCTVNLGKYCYDYTEGGIILYPLKNLYYDGYVKIDNAYYVDQYSGNSYNSEDTIYGKIVEVNGNQYYIPNKKRYFRDIELKNNAYSNNSDHGCTGFTTVPIAIKL